jgi:acetoin:2,6-dichlorophenolindophenol oxidoreductase subunit alpha
LISLLDRYGYMLWMREFELACLEGVPTREIHGELHTGIGQEAIAAGIVGSLRADDALCSTHRNHLHAIAKGVDMRAMLAEIFERESGLCGGYGGHMHLMDPKLKFSATGIVGAGVPVALGHAYAARLKNSDAVAVAIIGDGAVNTGAFHEAMNLAGVLQLPMIVVVENNEWAISVPFEASSPTATVAERAPAWAASGVKIDGNNVEKMAEVFQQAVEKARSGGGPSLIEASCYRFRGHFEGDADTYRSQQEKQERRQIDPLTITRSLLLERELANHDQLTAMETSVRSAVLEMLAQVRSEPHPKGEHALRHVFVEAGS